MIDPFLRILSLGLALGLGVCLGILSTKKLERRRIRYQPTREQLLSWIDQAPIGWMILDPDNRVRLINEKAQRLLEIPARYKTPFYLADLSTMHLMIDLIENVREHPQPKRLEWESGHQDLEVFAYSGMGGAVAILLQSRRSLEAQLAQQERWVTDVAHELKTPLTALLLVGDSLAGSVTNQNAVLVERLLKELRRMRDLVGDLLELSRLENMIPGEGINRQTIDLLSLIHDVWSGIKPLAEEKNISIEIVNNKCNDLSFKFPISCDPKRLHRALLNLLDNALQFSPENGKIRVELEATSDWICIRIHDQGIGLTADDLGHMFDRFYRGDPSRFRHKRGGSGLGLAIVQQIALAHGGWVFGENDSAGGARFELRLPANGHSSLRI